MGPDGTSGGGRRAACGTVKTSPQDRQRPRLPAELSGARSFRPHAQCTSMAMDHPGETPAAAAAAAASRLNHITFNRGSRGTRKRAATRGACTVAADRGTGVSPVRCGVAGESKTRAETLRKQISEEFNQFFPDLFASLASLSQIRRFGPQYRPNHVNDRRQITSPWSRRVAGGGFETPVTPTDPANAASSVMVCMR